ncbi:MAG: hypothetical protein Kow00120_26690 [Anaerolineae bacterium]
MPEADGVTVTDAVRAYLARRRQPTPQARDAWLVLQHLELHALRAGKTRLAQIGELDWLDWAIQAAEALALHATPRHVGRAMEVVETFLKWAVRQGYIEAFPAIREQVGPRPFDTRLLPDLDEDGGEVWA